MSKGPVVISCPFGILVRGANILSQSFWNHEIFRANTLDGSGPQIFGSTGWMLQWEFMEVRSALLCTHTLSVYGASVRQDNTRQVNYLLELSVYVEVLKVAATIILGEFRHE